MRLLKLYSSIHQFDTFDTFAQEFELGADDLVVTHGFLYDDYMAHLKLPCSWLFQEKYGAGEPSDEMIDAMMADAPGNRYKRVIAVGGGTVIDIAKLFALKRAPRSEMLFDKSVPPLREKKLIIVPTTCGTGSEVTNLSIAELKRKHTKLGLADDNLLADDAVLIPALLKKLPYKFFVFSSIDALIHAMESMVSPKSNPYTEMFARRAIEMILEGYTRIIKDGPDARLDYLAQFLIASNFAGIAFGNTGVGAVHAMSYPLGAAYHVAHGEANYQFLTAVMGAYYQSNPDGRIRGLCSLLGGLLGEVDSSRVFDALAQRLGAIISLKPLREYGMKPEETDSFAASVIEKQQRLLVNSYVPMDAHSIARIYKQLY
jgi:4-hydroxybutyrate dehydrogenase